MAIPALVPVERPEFDEFFLDGLLVDASLDLPSLNEVVSGLPVAELPVAELPVAVGVAELLAGEVCVPVTDAIPLLGVCEAAASREYESTRGNCVHSVDKGGAGGADGFHQTVVEAPLPSIDFSVGQVDFPRPRRSTGRDDAGCVYPSVKAQRIVTFRRQRTVNEFPEPLFISFERRDPQRRPAVGGHNGLAIEGWLKSCCADERGFYPSDSKPCLPLAAHTNSAISPCTMERDESKSDASGLGTIKPSWAQATQL
jgi:hypothetical protein